MNSDALFAPPRPRRPVTGEQQLIVDVAKRRGTAKVRAFAGTGKSSTSEEVAAEIAPAPMLYVAYNTSMAAEMRPRMRPHRHVKVSTAHALAMSEVGHLFRDRLVGRSFALREAIEARYRARLMRMSSDPRLAADVVLTTVQAYQNSGALEIDTEHVPRDVDILASTGTIIGLATDVFTAMTDPAGDMPLSHDTYFKYWQAVVQPRLDERFELIVFDEAQDANPVMLAVLEDQQCAKLVIGDPYQSLYSFRGAVNAIESLDYEELALTQSWRFGPAIAAIANPILALHGERRPMRGTPSIDTNVVMYSPALPDMVLARTNAGVFEEALALVDGGQTVSIVGGVDELVGMVLGAYELSVHGRSTHPAFRFFRRFADLVEAAKGPRGAEYAPFVRIVERYEDLIPEKCAAIRDGVGGDEAVRISTVHKAKGLEAPHVRLAGDFAPFCVYDKKRRLVFRPEEANVHYVAITRAQQLLEIGGGFAAIYQSSLANGNYLRGFAPPAAIATVVAEARGLR